MGKERVDSFLNCSNYLREGASVGCDLPEHPLRLLIVPLIKVRARLRLRSQVGEFLDRTWYLSLVSIASLFTVTIYL